MNRFRTDVASSEWSLCLSCETFLAARNEETRLYSQAAPVPNTYNIVIASKLFLISSIIILTYFFLFSHKKPF